MIVIRMPEDRALLIANIYAYVVAWKDIREGRERYRDGIKLQWVTLMLLQVLDTLGEGPLEMWD